ncbi:MAG: TlpA family protein disulfide reductase [bacterium]|nr:MAG: TlpA family protein disulfide reductase [bacterium]
MRIHRALSVPLLLLFLFSLTVGISYGVEERPDFSLFEYKSGQKKSFNDILLTRANVMVVTETTCVSCIKELRSLDWLRAKYRGDMAVIGVFVDREGESRVIRYLDYYKFDLDMFLVDPGNEIPLKFKVDFLPTMIIFDEKGNEVRRKKGFEQGDESLISAMVDEVLNRKRAAARAVPTPSATAVAPEKRTTGCASTG